MRTTSAPRSISWPTQAAGSAGSSRHWPLRVSGAIIFYLRRLDSRAQALQCAGLALIASGAIGNLIDRLRLGFVEDFVHVHWGAAYFPAFNVADSCISIGAGLIILEALLEARRGRVTP